MAAPAGERRRAWQRRPGDLRDASRGAVCGGGATCSRYVATASSTCRPLLCPSLRQAPPPHPRRQRESAPPSHMRDMEEAVTAHRNYTFHTQILYIYILQRRASL